jgi:hypothetical protein
MGSECGWDQEYEIEEGSDENEESTCEDGQETI